MSQHDSPVAKQQLDEWLDEALADTFPASDAIAFPPGGGASDTGAHTRTKVNAGQTRRAR